MGTKYEWQNLYLNLLQLTELTQQGLWEDFFVQYQRLSSQFELINLNSLSPDMDKTVSQDLLQKIASSYQILKSKISKEIIVTAGQIQRVKESSKFNMNYGH